MRALFLRNDSFIVKVQFPLGKVRKLLIYNLSYIEFGEEIGITKVNTVPSKSF